jgi:type I restriction enzyme S subunit
MLSNYKRLGDYIHKVENRNRDLKVSKLVGLSMTKEFRVSTSNIVGTDMSVYKVVNKWQFSCDFMSVIRVHKFPVVLKTDDDPVLVSPAYTVFEVNDENELNPEYLMMWFRRSEFDRYADFKCDSAIRGGFDWDALCDCMLPIPSIEKQREIVREYNTIQNRIALNNQMISKLEDTAQAIYKQWFVDFEFPFDFAQGKPSENGKPYKSNGGKMVWCEELEKEIPEGWRVGNLTTIANYKNGLAMQNFESENEKEFLPVIKIRELNLGKTDLDSNKCIIEIPEEVKIDDGDLIFSWSGTLMIDFWVGGKGGLNQHLFKVTSKKFKKWFYYLATKFHLDEFIRIADGNKTSLGHIKREHLENAIVFIPEENQLIYFDGSMKILIENLINIKKETKKLEELKELLLGRMVRN